MDEERNAEFCRLRQHRAHAGVIEMTVARAPAEQGAFEAKLADGPFQLARCRLRTRGRQGREALEPTGMSGAGFRDQIVHALRGLDGRAGCQIVKPRRGQGEHLDVDALLIHQRQTTFPQIGEAHAVFAAIGDSGHRIVRQRRDSPGVADGRREDMLLDRDQAHVSPSWNVASGMKTGRRSSDFGSASMRHVGRAASRHRTSSHRSPTTRFIATGPASTPHILGAICSASIAIISSVRNGFEQTGHHARSTGTAAGP